ncbi:MAG TPA: hypothetical protein V6C58_23460 [Allocoleopsis sp.]
MSRRTSIVKAIADKLKVIDGSEGYKTNLFNNSYDKLKFWDEVNDFPSVFVVAGSETREYMPASFAWGFLNVCIKIYCKGEDSQQELENLMEDIENVLNSTRGNITYDLETQYETTELSITSITTDEGLLSPYAVGEITVLIRYEVH